MEIIKKYGVKILAAIALIALFLPMASFEIGVSMFGYSASNSVSVTGMDVAFGKYLCLLLIVGPVAIFAADYVAAMKKFKVLLQAGVSVLGVIFYIVGYLQAGSVASEAQGMTMGLANVDTSIGFGTILGILAYGGIIALTVLYEKDELKANIEALKNGKANATQE